MAYILLARAQSHAPPWPQRCLENVECSLPVFLERENRIGDYLVHFCHTACYNFPSSTTVGTILVSFPEKQNL